MEINHLHQLDLSKNIYTYSDYLLWKFKERIELFKGRIFEMSPAPSRIHQRVQQKLGTLLENILENGNCGTDICEVYPAVFDVRFPDKDGVIRTVLQPDLCVVCDKNKLDDRGCIGAPDLIVEILSPANSNKEMRRKFNIYEENGVSEYWIVRPHERYIQIYVLENRKYKPLDPFLEDDLVTSVRFPQLSFTMDKIFGKNTE